MSGLSVHPGRSEFCELASRYAIVPVWCEIVADTVTPVGAFLSVVGDESGFLLESVEGGERWGRYSFVGRAPLATIERTPQGVVVRGELPVARAGGMLATVEAVLSAYRVPALPGLPPLHSGLVGYLGYDVVREVEHLPDVPPDDRGLPDAALTVIGQLASFDHWRQRVVLVDNVVVPPDAGQAVAGDRAYDAACARLEDLATRCCRGGRGTPMQVVEGGRAAAATRTMSAKSYRSAVKVAKEFIAAGDAFQIVLSQRFDLELGADPFDVYRALRLLNPSPYLYFLRLPEVTVVGSSPEPMVRLRDGVVTSRPVAGSRPRGKTDEEDRRLGAELSQDPKEVAEHVMLVDLARNDVGRVVRFGTEHVEELMSVERYSHIMHLTSQVSGELAPGKDAVDVLRATLPAGTLSGAPKVRAMQIIDELEPTKRGIYGGIVGYLDFSGNLDTAIAIRTLVATPDGRASVQAGAGIVADSDPVSEDEECGHKAAALLAAVEAARHMRAAGPAAANRPDGAAESVAAPRTAPATEPAPALATEPPRATAGPGWEPDDLEDYGALRTGVVAHRLPRDVLRLCGPDAVGYLQGQCSQDVEALAVGSSADALLLEPGGKIDAFVRVVRLADDELLIDVDAGLAEAVVARLRRFKLRSRFEIEPLSWSCVALRVPGDDPSAVPGLAALEHAALELASAGDGASARVVWPGWSGLDLLGPEPEARVPAELRWCGERAWEARRVETGIPVMGRELDGRTIPAEAGLVDRAVSLTKGCFTGQELVARLDARANRVPYRLLGVVLEEDVPAGFDAAASELRVAGKDKPVGRLTSAVWSPALGRTVALAFVHRSVPPPAPVIVASAGRVAGPAEVRELPLVGR